MPELAHYSHVVESVYDCALDAARWPDALEAICRFVEGSSANLFYQGVIDNEASLFHDWGQDPHYRDLYIETYAHLNPLFPASTFLEVGTISAVGEIIPWEEFTESRMYKEWVEPQGLGDALYTNLERTAAGAAALAIQRNASEGLFDQEAKARFALLVPHVRRAVAIGKLIDFHKGNEAALSRTLDGLDAAVLLVAPDGRLVYVNETASEMLTSGTILHASRGRLAAVDPRADRELHDAITGATRGDMDLGAKGVAISLASDEKSSQIAHVLPLKGGTRHDMLHSQAATALFVQKTTRSSPAPIEIATQLHGLTAGEVRVLAAVAEHTGVATMANALGIGEETVRTHLRRIFDKTGARRQADLVKLLAGYASPLRT